MRVLYRADGSPDIGTGHIIRGLILQRRLADIGAHVTFLTRDLPWGVDKLRQAGCHVIVIPGAANTRSESDALRRAVQELAPDVVVMDVLETPEELTRGLRDAGSRVVCLDDVGPGRLNADAVVNILEVEPEPELLTRRGITLHQGPEYAALPEAYAEPGIAEREIPPKVRRVLVTLGGADPAVLAPKAARGLKLAFESRRGETAFDDPRVMLLLGSASPHRMQVLDAIGRADERFEMVDSIPSLLPALREADLGIIAGGLTMHEALAVGLPSLALCQDVRHQPELAQRFADQGAMLTLGAGAAVTEAQIAGAIVELAGDPELRRRLACRGPQLVDGHGARRTAELIMRTGSGAPSPP